MQKQNRISLPTDAAKDVHLVHADCGFPKTLKNVLLLSPPINAAAFLKPI